MRLLPLLTRGRSCLAIALLGSAFCLSCSADPAAGYGTFTEAQTLERQAQLDPVGSQSFDLFGESVALSSTAAIIGAPGADRDATNLGDDSGSASVFVRDGNSWLGPQTIRPPQPLPFAQFGWSVAINATTAVVGAPYSDPNQGMGPVDTVDAGLVFVLQESSGDWSGPPVLVNDPAPAAFRKFGRAVAVAEDTVFASSPGDIDTPGIVYAFAFSGSDWSVKQELTPPPTVTEGDYFGGVIAIDGATMLISAEADTEKGVDAGAVYVFTLINGVWSRQQKLLGDDSASGDYFGGRVALSGDWAVIGSSANAGYLGAAYVFHRDAGVWSQKQKLVALDATASDGFASAIAVSDHGIFVGSPYRAVTGAIYRFALNLLTWTATDPIVLSKPLSEDQVGFALAASGPHLLVGAPATNAYQGRAYALALGAGSTCSVAADCVSAHCVEGVCCNEDCDNPCESCLAARKTTGADGTCGPIKAHTNPRGAPCATTGPETCGQNGYCDGAGSCSFHGAGVECAAPRCASDGAEQAASLCDGHGSCTDAKERSCEGYVCSESSCQTKCVSDSDCISDQKCVEGTCQPKRGNGAKCSADRDCLSEHCVDQVCCDTECSSQCAACAEPNLHGTCVSVGGVPRPGRPACDGAAPDEPCLQTTCDGSEVAYCAGFVDVSVVCQTASCSDGVVKPESRCDGFGSCKTARSLSCGAYACGETTCLTECTSERDCAPGSYCADGKCLTGARCSSDRSAAIQADGREEPCDAYRCEDGVCLQRCSRTSDCAPDHACGPESSECEPIDGAPRESSACSCRLPGGRQRSSSRVLALGALAILSFRRALRRALRSSNQHRRNT